jgi:Tfp pilus assembly protein PilF
LGFVLSLSGKHDESFKQLDKALQVANQENNLQHQLKTLYSIGTFHTQLKQFDQGNSYLKQALTIAQQLKDNNFIGKVFS